MNASLYLIMIGLGLIALGALRAELYARELLLLGAPTSDDQPGNLAPTPEQGEDMLTLLEREHEALPEEKRTAPARPSSLAAQPALGLKSSHA